ncbi:YkgJ family cysteine cluster protein [Campylobacter hepaticus]|uniref:YkgJ family cysteine cluster protein n=1 Tax=Campylobacter hepaticus TaxID=1813019 RepID=A0A424YZH7_9BACT|nr:YkgJ family cysteine cluster protein [Campylobacter hepaticus]AXP08215.1 YkgJ family cysteine cluster protein [Campylobacter hepaticus]MCZ0772688.1 YkgJ family cysteine cluster protein [Campylobacter hepaticus]MCZ0774156.1 YkgJ family cysteine cluster protein [Campylobacter hepaticus]MCZ0775408.1 YkgJ family cysteine cluster protein [Campylobacter hepaticus]MDX2323834.1 YkgJ family cysteine cluster protein [Campylobacter hepaticus]
MIFNKNFSYAFDQSACEKCGGKCCIGESGNIFASKEELETLRKHFNLSSEEFARKYLRKVGFKMSFKEVEFEDGFACIFFDTQKRNCSIYDFRPKQCRTFPFWEYFKTHQKELEKECIGICYLS